MARFGFNPSQHEHYQATARLLYAASAKVGAAHDAELRGDKGAQWTSTVDAYGLLEQALSQAKDGDVPRGEIAEARGARDKLRAQIIAALGGSPHQHSQATMLNPYRHNPSVWPWLLGLGLVGTGAALVYMRFKEDIAARMNQQTKVVSGQQGTPRVTMIDSAQQAVTLIGNKPENVVAYMYCKNHAQGEQGLRFLEGLSADPANAGISFYAADVAALMGPMGAKKCESTIGTLAVQRAIPQGAQVVLETVDAASDPKLVAWAHKGAPVEEAIHHAVKWVHGQEGPAPSQTRTVAA